MALRNQGAIGIDADSCLVQTDSTTLDKAHVITQAHALLHGEEERVFDGSGKQGIQKNDDIQEQHLMVPSSLNREKQAEILHFFHHLNLHPLIRAGAGVMQTFPI